MKSWRLGENGKRRVRPGAAVHRLGLRIVGVCPLGTLRFSHQFRPNPTRSNQINPASSVPVRMVCSIVKVNQSKSNQFKPPPRCSCGPHFGQIRLNSTTFFISATRNAPLPCAILAPRSRAGRNSRKMCGLPTPALVTRHPSQIGIGTWNLVLLWSLELGRLELYFPTRRSSRDLCGLWTP